MELEFATPISTGCKRCVFGHVGLGKVCSALMNPMYLERQSAWLIIAHFDPSGELPPGLVNWISQASRIYSQVLLISTFLSTSAERKVGDHCRIIRRNNTGYDFGSYRLGLELVWQEKVLPMQVTLMNSSFIISAPDRFAKFVASSFAQADEVRGVSISYYKRTRHLQSFFLSIPHSLLSKEQFRQWWLLLPVLNDRDRVIEVCEIGFSVLVQGLGYKLRAPFETRLWARLFSKIRNPMFSRFAEVERQLGIYKVQLVRDNPFGQDIEALRLHYRHEVKGSDSRALKKVGLQP